MCARHLPSISLRSPGNPPRPLTRAAKAAVNIIAKSLHCDLRPDGRATVLLLHPGYVRTDMTGGAGTTFAQTRRDLSDRRFLIHGTFLIWQV